jgi:hypothetical protein
MHKIGSETRAEASTFPPESLISEGRGWGVTMLMSAEDVARVGEFLFGARYKTELARALKVSVRQVHRWSRRGGPKRCYRVEIARLVEERHYRDRIRVERNYQAMVERMSSASIVDTLKRGF